MQDGKQPREGKIKIELREGARAVFLRSCEAEGLFPHGRKDMVSIRNPIKD